MLPKVMYIYILLIFVENALYTLKTLYIDKKIYKKKIFKSSESCKIILKYTIIVIDL